MIELTATNQVFLATVAAGRRERRLAFAILGVSVAIFLLLAPFAKTPLFPVWAFIPCYESALVISDLITAVLLFGQFGSYRSKALLALGSGYLFTAFMTIAHALTFPGLFAPSGWLGAGPQSTAWLYMLWHGGFPLFVIAYSLLKNFETKTVATGTSVHLLVLAAIAATAALAGGFVLLTTAGQDLLPPIIIDNHYTPAMIFVVSCVWSLSVIALIAVWWKRPHAILDLWLMVVICAWLIDIALSALLNGGRFDLGFYAGRIYGLLAATVVLLMLLVENGLLYANLAKMASELQRLSAIDPLTGIANRRVFDAELDGEWRRAIRNNMPLSLLMIDIDHFKNFNDSYGHVTGDQCLRSVAHMLAENARRAGNVVARYGGEEFAMLLPQTDATEAYRLGQHICHALVDLALPHRLSPSASHVTVSIGVACLAAEQPDSTASVLLASHSLPNGALKASSSVLVEAADLALYAAKLSGRNRVSLGGTITMSEAVCA